MKRHRQRYIVIAIGFLVACTSTPSPTVPRNDLNPIVLDDTIEIITGQTVYAPIYTQIYIWEQNRALNLTATLSIRNTDMTNSIILTSVDYYDSAGKRLHNYLEQPVELQPLASTNFVVDQDDIQGGITTSFIVEWVAQQQVSNPIIESIMINTSSNQGVSFVSPGRVIKSRAKDK